MTDTHALAVTRLLEPAGLDEVALAATLARAMRRDTDIADLFVEERASESWSIADGRITGGSYSSEAGFGLRLVSGERTAFAYSGDLSSAALHQAVAAVASKAEAAAIGSIKLEPVITTPLYDAIDPTGAWTMKRKTSVLIDIDARARAADPRIVKVFATLSLFNQVMLLVREDGRSVGDVRPLVHLSVQVLAEQSGRRENGSYAIGGRFGPDAFDSASVDSCVARAVEIALINLDARPGPAGPMSVVLGPGYPGVLFHEAVGHGLESDFIRKRTSVFSGRLGERVAAPGVTVVDDGSIARARGSLSIDDEGEATQPTVLIEDGILKGFMQDRMNAGLTNARPTGNGRRQSYAHLPMPRMTNTFLAGGDRDPAEIITSVKDGIYAAEFGGGEVDITSGRFSFSSTLAWRIENGRLTYPVKGATLVGEGARSLRGIAMIGNDFTLDPGTAFCGKSGQTLPVCVGQPTLRIDEMLVGGGG